MSPSPGDATGGGDHGAGGRPTPRASTRFDR